MVTCDTTLKFARAPRISMPLRPHLVAILLFFTVAIFIDGPADIRADHNPGPREANAWLDKQFGNALPLTVDGEPIDEVIVAPEVPRDCWTVREFPYTVRAALDRKAECRDPWEIVHKAYSFQVQEGGTYTAGWTVLAGIDEFWQYSIAAAFAASFGTKELAKRAMRKK